MTEEVPDSRAKVVRAATDLFVRDGFQATSMKAIADHVGLTTPALYWHFESKQALYLTSMTCLLSDFVSFVAERVVGTDPETRLRQFVSAHVAWRLEQREAAGAYTAALGSRSALEGFSQSDRAKFVALQREHLDRLSSILVAGRDAGVFGDASRVTAFAIITICDHVSSWYDPAGRTTPERIAALYSDCFMRMLQPTVEARPAAV